MRIKDHPILGPLKEVKEVTISFNGRQIKAIEGEPIAAALYAKGIRVLRRTRLAGGEPRGIFCAIGRCTDCVMVIDGVPNVRTCITPVRDGMRVEFQEGMGKWEKKK